MTSARDEKAGETRRRDPRREHPARPDRRRHPRRPARALRQAARQQGRRGRGCAACPAVQRLPGSRWTPARLAEIRALSPETVVRHEECQRILVRTAESGL
ncbi:hypothetical protein G5V59_00625 [Nocardioides sp. W3-2-3]|uniref:hypothetical protein n=1 Tax=Nocardioides convexus TaxID=2712224 RepID=UPI002418868A|nr:hypothetical protein [Nocardioides convexus]NGZ99448.1 hypothetical protein [Nocardioides convexus]